MDDTIDRDGAAPADPEQTGPPEPEQHDIVEVGRTMPSTKRSSSRGFGSVVLGLALVAVIALQIMILQRVNTSRDDLDATRGAIAGLQVDVRGIDDRVVDLTEQVDGLSMAQATGGSGQSDAISVAPGSLPPFTDPQSDLAVRDGYVLGSLSGLEYYSDAETTIDPSDGTARVWMIWAHWCPYCQQELPAVANWWPENRDRFPNSDLVSVTTSMDETRGNPLVPYLDSEQFPFPVLMDPDLRLGQQFGTSAFPFWVVTDGDGKVVFRVAGAIGVDAIESIFSQVDQLASS
jgi:thiol-disulfide isomerase/thioredoxin